MMMRFLDVELYELKDNTLIFSKDIFFYPSYGDNIFEVHTEEGYFLIKINVQELEKPHLYSSSTIYYESQTDSQLEFKLLGGSFVKLGGNDITDDDYYYQDPILTIKTSYIEDIITNNPDRKTIILSYQLEKNEDSYTGLIFIYIE